jgi:hypothetical protein
MVIYKLDILLYIDIKGKVDTPQLQVKASILKFWDNLFDSSWR